MCQARKGLLGRAERPISVRNRWTGGKMYRTVVLLFLRDTREWAMNCQNCGAAMTLVAGRDYFRCNYCLSFHFPAGSGEDGVRVLGGGSGLDCPVCHESLQDGRVESEPVQYCQRCRGFLATNP